MALVQVHSYTLAGVELGLVDIIPTGPGVLRELTGNPIVRAYYSNWADFYCNKTEIIAAVQTLGSWFYAVPFCNRNGDSLGFIHLQCASDPANLPVMAVNPVFSRHISETMVQVFFPGVPAVFMTLENYNQMMIDIALVPPPEE